VSRRSFITLLGGAAAWPLTARAQQPERMRHVAVLLAGRMDDSDLQARLAGLRSGLERLGIDAEIVPLVQKIEAGSIVEIENWKGLGSMLCAPIPHSLRSDSLIRTHDAINGMTLE